MDIREVGAERGGLSKIPSKGMKQKRGEGTQKFKKEGGVSWF